MAVLKEDGTVLTVNETGYGRRSEVTDYRLQSLSLIHIYIISRLLDGDFLDYKSAIPSNNATHVRVNTKLFIDSIERTSLLITDRLKSPVRCVFDENTIRISSITSLGSANDKIDAVIDGNRVEIGFNNRFMLEALKVVDTDEVRIELNGAVSPILILPPEGDSFLFLVLPVRLKNEN